ncbi:hypothetical protein SAMN05421504_11765 [Amycolatopsis xylanica]|uniref:Uncharacterized protein n=1 Tax=Amycolatopsis xylanica TaxID=589385 RepID=A0A1H3T647_9PSEU|nr:hypothetical protein [Amycolatopsis xylanica]SDZ44809.1 hypothetical protein SAMN05421504_11765 [Amycolatopsis xylanica]
MASNVGSVTVVCLAGFSAGLLVAAILVANRENGRPPAPVGAVVAPTETSTPAKPVTITVTGRPPARPTVTEIVPVPTRSTVTETVVVTPSESTTTTSSSPSSSASATGIN